MNSAQLINQTSGDVEYFTPAEIVEAARLTMGKIDLDPASSHEANKRVMAGGYWTPSDDSLHYQWHGAIWMNHPFGRNENPIWINKLLSEWNLGHVTSACCLTYACTSEQWFQPLLKRPQCFLSPRTNFLLPDGSVKRGVTKGSVVTYFGQHPLRFLVCFEKLGVVKAAL